ncbi:XapX domain-containing protein [Streptomyces sp. NPDC054842]
MRAAGFSFAAGLLMGAVYWALDITSPAPPLLGLTGLAGIVAGERAASWVRTRRGARREPGSTSKDPAPAPPSASSSSSPSPSPSAPGEDTPS